MRLRTAAAASALALLTLGGSASAGPAAPAPTLPVCVPGRAFAGCTVPTSPEALNGPSVGNAPAGATVVVSGLLLPETQPAVAVVGRLSLTG